MPAEFICRKLKKKKYLEQNLIFERYANSSNMNQRFLKDKKKDWKSNREDNKGSQNIRWQIYSWMDDFNQKI